MHHLVGVTQETPGLRVSGGVIHGIVQDRDGFVEVVRAIKDRAQMDVGLQQAGVDLEGGAGAQGVSPNPDYLWVDSLETAPLVAGAHTVTLGYAGSGSVHAKVDALLLQPEVESRLLGGGTRQLALYKSLAGEAAPFQLPSGRRWQVSVYDRNGEAMESESAGAGGLRIPPYGSVIASSE